MSCGCRIPSIAPITIVVGAHFVSLKFFESFNLEVNLWVGIPANDLRSLVTTVGL